MAIRPARRASLKATHKPSRGRAASLLVLAAFVLLLVLAHLFGQPPVWTLWVYAGLSALTFLVYAIDKSAARSGAWRTPERTLHGLALAGGWPGALLAQQVLRHKSSKLTFLAAFWCLVAVNVSVYVFLAFPDTLGCLRRLLASWR